MKQGQLIKGLRSAHLRLCATKKRFPPGPDREYEPSVVEAKRDFHLWFFRVFEHGLDATDIVQHLNRLV